MNVHEYQAKELLAKFGVNIPAGIPALTVEEAVEAAKQLPGPVYVVKAQIHAGGRGKGKFKELPADAKGGVRLAKTIEEVETHAREMLGNTLVTVQTGKRASRSIASMSPTASTSPRNTTSRWWSIAVPDASR
jgi:succinyl-CoA synthetase beta subunit